MNQIIQIKILEISDQYLKFNVKGPSEYYKWEYSLNANSSRPEWVTCYQNSSIKIKENDFTIYGLSPLTYYYVQFRAQTSSSSSYDGSRILMVQTSEIIPQIDLELTSVNNNTAQFYAYSRILVDNWEYSLDYDSPNPNWISITPSANRNVTFSINNLLPNYDYGIWVRGRDSLSGGANTPYVWSSKIIFTTSSNSYDIGLEEESIDISNAVFNIYPNGIVYHNWAYKIDNRSWIGFTPTGSNPYVLTIPITSPLVNDHTYKLQVKALDPSGFDKYSQQILFHTVRTSAVDMTIEPIWIETNRALFHLTLTDPDEYYDSIQYSTAVNADTSKRTDEPDCPWTDIDLEEVDDGFTFMIEAPFPIPADSDGMLSDDTYYSLRLRMVTRYSTSGVSNTVIFKTERIPESYFINIDWESATSNSATFDADSLASYRIWEYTIAMNPTENDWVRVADFDTGESNIWFTVRSLNPSTSYILRMRCKVSSNTEYVYSDSLIFETLASPIPVYVPPENAIVHRTIVDFIRRPITDPVKIVQYDQDCPIVAVTLYKNGEEFFVPGEEDVHINIRFGKPDHTFVYNPAEGLNKDRTIAYFKITKQMTVYHGIFNPVVEYVVGDKVAASGSFQIRIDRNPIQNGDIESSVEYKTVQEYSQEAQHAAEMLQNVSADAVELPQHAPAYANYDLETGTFHFGLPAGGDGGVESVNGKTGVVEIDSGDIPYDSEETVEEKLQNLEESKANIDGYYENLGAGTADQLVSTTYEEDSVPYSFRTSGGSTDVGDLEYDEIVGGTIAWNQLMQNGNFATATSWQRNRCDLTVVDNIGRFTCNSAEYASWGFYQSPSGIVGHKYLGIGSFRCHTNNEARSLTFQSSGVRMINVIGQTRQNYPINDTWYDLSFIGIFNEVSATASCNLGYASSSDIVANTDYIEAKNVMLFDLTQMFGPDIADYIYSLEAETTGNGIAYFRKLFPNAYYTTDAGTLMSVKAASHKMIGFNVWDEEWELGAMNDFTGANSVSSSNIRSKNYIRVVPNTTYSIECASGHRYYLFYYDADKNYLGRNDANNKGTFLSDGGTYYRTMTSNCHYVRFFYDATSYNNDFCIHLKWSGYRDGEYEAHKERVYPLDSSLELRGIPKLDASNNLYYDGDTYKSNGSVRRRFYEISSTDCTVGTYVAPRWALTYSSPLPAMLSVDTSAVANIKASRYFTTKSKNGLGNGSTSKYEISQADGSGARRRLIFTIDSSIVETQQEAQDWVTNHPFTILFECAEPSDESAAAFTSPQLVDDFGTEEYIDYGVQQGTRDVSVPVGHNTKYLQNLRDKLQHLPNLPDPLEDGDYKIHVSGQQMTLIPDDGGGLYDVSFEGYINLISGDYTWFCSKSNSRILDAIDAGSVVRASVVVDNMPDNTMYLCQYSNLDGLVSFYGMALIPINETNTICYVQLYQSTENSWSSIFTPIQ